MAKIRAGILSKVSGKVAGVVGGTWKNVNYLREFVIPANPNTADQQVQRALFSGAVAFAKLVLGQILNVFVDPFQKSMSGFNYFIKQNIDFFTTPPDWSSVKITWGKLWNPAVTAAVYAGANVTITFPTTLGANGAATDKARAVVYDSVNGIPYFNTTGVARSTGTIVVVCAAGLTADDLMAYLFFSQLDPAGNLYMVSDSDFNEVSS